MSEGKKRRSRGDGSVYKRADGKWIAAVSVTGGDGSRSTHRRVCATEREAKARARELVAQLRAGVAPTSGTVSAFLDDWLEHGAKPNVRLSTYTVYSSYIRLHISPVLGRIRLQDLTTQDVQRWLAAKSAEGLAPSTVMLMRTVLVRALNYALKWRMITYNPASLAETPRGARFNAQAWSADEARAFLASVRGDRMETLYTLTLQLGLRKGEALGLQWSDINLATGTLTVRHNLQRQSRALVLTLPKTAHSVRALPLPPALIASLQAHRNRQRIERIASPRRLNTDYVFSHPDGSPIDPRQYNKWFDAAIKRAGVPRIRLHDLRHSCATLLLSEGVPLLVVSRILGHSGIGITADLYGHITQAEKLSALGTLGDALKG